uniref:Ig-like domain-containing protein n=1 Tax=Ciona intestinalis TaxID=7719 RepID=F6Z4P1_CIOIN
WGAWSSWSECSRSCGGGASYSRRVCLTRDSCEGINTRYKTCENQDCTETTQDFRAEQCSLYNTTPYKGILYTWKAVVQKAQPCALYCKAHGFNITTKLAPQVLDGTKCKDNSDDMCINGACQAVGCDKKLHSDARYDVCGKCQGDGSTCRLVTGLHRFNPVKHRGTEVVITVPQKSRHISVSERGSGHIALHNKTKDENQGVLEHSGIVVEYGSVASGKEYLDVAGPVPQDMKVLALYDDTMWKYIRYEFYRPLVVFWKHDETSARCPVTCGAGVTFIKPICVDMASGEQRDDEACHAEGITPPLPKVFRCKLEDCPISEGNRLCLPLMPATDRKWLTQPWTECSASCDGGFQTRTISCAEDNIYGDPIETVGDTLCHNAGIPVPVSQRRCNEHPCPEWITYPWSQCSASCGAGWRYRTVQCQGYDGTPAFKCSKMTKPIVRQLCFKSMMCPAPGRRISIPTHNETLAARGVQRVDLVLSRPNWMTDTWGDCSHTCGAGVATRVVACKAAAGGRLETVPDDECVGEKPITTTRCSMGACRLEEVSDEFDPLDLENYEWRFSDFSSCTPPCGRGFQYSKQFCHHRVTGAMVSEDRCDVTMKQTNKSLSCIGEPCDVISCCSRELRWIIVPSEDLMCPSPKPESETSCSLVACSPEWVPEPWTKCSRTCGRGEQERELMCMQRLGTGETVQVSKEYCSRKKPESETSCSLVACSPEWVPEPWTKCSRTCGRGEQERELMCMQRLGTGETVQVSKEYCSRIKPMSLICPKDRAACDRESRRWRKHVRQIVKSPDPVFVQTTKEAKVRLQVGTTASIFPKTTVIVRCKTDRFRKQNLVWKYHGRPITSRHGHLSILKDGSLRILRVAKPDEGVYVCMAGVVRANFVLKIITNDTVLKIPELSYGIQQLAIERVEPRSSRRPSLSVSPVNIQRDQQAPDVVNIPSEPLSPEFQIRTPSFPEPTSEEDLALHRFLMQQANLETPDVHVSFRFLLYMWLKSNWEQYVTIRNHFSGYLMNRTPSSLLPTSVEDDDLPFPFRETEIAVDNQRSRSGIRSVDNTAVVKAIGGLGERPRNMHRPSIITQPTVAPRQLEREVIVYVGGNVIVSEITEVITILCEATGDPVPHISWYRDNTPLPAANNRSLSQDNAFRIIHPEASDTGSYVCVASNMYGNDSKTTPLTVTQKPRILSTIDSLEDFESDVIEATIGSDIRAKLGARIRLRCPTAVIGFPEPYVDWKKDGPGLLQNSNVLTDNTLEIFPARKADQGIFSCEASNPAGSDYQASSLVLVDPPHLDDLNTKANIDGLPELLLTTTDTQQYNVKVNSAVMMGCPVKGFPEPRVTWSFNNTSIFELGTTLDYQLMDQMKILQIPNADSNTEGTYTCHAINDGGNLTTSLRLSLVVYSYEYGEHTPCSASCGDNGLQYRRLMCMEDGVKEVDEWYCIGVTKPNVYMEPCGRRDCPPRFLAGRWGTCSATCGNGTRTRALGCGILMADGSTREVAVEFCGVNETRPITSETCYAERCPWWQPRPWRRCSRKCIGRGMSVRTRRILCVSGNGTTIERRSACKHLPKPRRRMLCPNARCKPIWVASTWSVCSKRCGGDGIRTRILNCVYKGRRRQPAGSLCSSRHRPLVSIPCNRSQCHEVPCVNKSPSCRYVRRKGLCLYYKRICCQTCS